jgi:hypothetical protein
MPWLGGLAGAWTATITWTTKAPKMTAAIVPYHRRARTARAYYQARSGQKREYLDWLEQTRSGTEWAPIPHNNADAAEAAVLLEVLPEADRLESGYSNRLS